MRVNEEGKEVILQVVGKGEVLGEATLFREGAQPTSAIALETARVCSLSRRHLEYIIRESPDLAMQVILSLGNRLYHTWEQVTELRTGSTREKVLNLLIRLAGEHGEPCPEGTKIKLYLTQQDIADFVGASRVMVVQALKELSARNCIDRVDKYLFSGIAVFNPLVVKYLTAPSLFRWYHYIKLNKRRFSKMGCNCCGCNAVLTPEIKEVIAQSAFVPITTLSGDGQPHLIVVGKVKEVRDDNTLVFGVYKMEKTRRNLAETGVMQVAAVAGKKGYRLSGKARTEGEEVLFKVEKADALL
ncbi:helix-turn-helix domain-containing protein [Desulfoscipio geothermicus]|uniref:pyridoxamine 5'-phosphate oxidase family protein n=1 Tax=Desulfoscipio geothermicus TaxID=39060 RepID=UPI003184470A